MLNICLLFFLQIGSSGDLFSSLTALDIAFEMNKRNIAVFTSDIHMTQTIKKIGLYTVEIDGLPIQIEVKAKFL